jgi:AcrR family transcriptional regulator
MSPPEPTPPPSADRDRIGRALVDLCFEHGYRDTTLPMLLERAGVDQRAFERHFSDLEDCFCVTLEAVRNEYFSRIGAAFAAQGIWRNQLRATAYASLRFLREDLPRARFLRVEVMYAGARAQLIRDQGMDVLCELIDRGRAELDDPDSVPRSTAESLAGGIYQRTHTAVERDDPQLWARLVPEFMYTLVLPYLGSEAALEELSIPPPDDLELPLAEAFDIPPPDDPGEWATS